MSNRTRKSDAEIGLCLVAEARDGKDWQDRIAAALDASRALTLILVAPEGAPAKPETVRALVTLAQSKVVAALIADDVAAARDAGADGVHITARSDVLDAFDQARSVLGPDAIVGADAGLSRHDAMELGEAGADYVAFDATRATEDESGHDLIAWWADLFVIPTVAFGAATAEDATNLVAVGADFVAVSLPPDLAPEAATSWATGMAAAIKPAPSAA